MKDKKCAECGNDKGDFKRGWTNAWYCSEVCELRGVSAVHDSMPGGPNPRPNWVPHHIGLEISRRWEDEREEGDGDANHRYRMAMVD